MKLLTEDLVAARKSLADSTSNPSSSSIVVEFDSTYKNKSLNHMTISVCQIYTHHTAVIHKMVEGFTFPEYRIRSWA